MWLPSLTLLSTHKKTPRRFLNFGLSAHTNGEFTAKAPEGTQGGARQRFDKRIDA
jgi:hypothetical protein